MKEQAFEILRVLLEDSKLAIAVTDTSGRLVLFNRGAESLTGYRAREVLGRSPGFLYSSQVRLAVRRELASRGFVDREAKLVARDGQTIPVSLLVTPLTDLFGRPIGTLGIALDLRPRKELERAVREARARAEFFTNLMCWNVGHFVTRALASLEPLLASEEITDRQRHVLGVCRRQARRMGALLEQIQLLVEIRRYGGRKLEPRDLVAIVEEAVEHAREVFRDRDVEILFHKPKGRVFVEVCALFGQVVANLLDNAVLHNDGDEPKVWVFFERKPPDKVRLVVEDNGPGIPDELKPKVFERFSTRQQSGSGVGLSVVRHIVESCEGRVWAEDRVAGQPSEGCRFVVELFEAEEGSCQR